MWWTVLQLFGFCTRQPRNKKERADAPENIRPTASRTQIDITDAKTMRTERKRRRKILIAIIMITHSRSAKTLCCNNNYVMLNTDSVRIFQGGGEKKNLLLKSSVVFKKAGVSRQMPKCNWHRELRGILIKNQIRWQRSLTRTETVSWLLHAAVTFDVARNEIKSIVSGLNRRALVWMVAAGLRDGERENKDAALTWFEWKTAN